jgi:hypothetical protein
LLKFPNSSATAFEAVEANVVARSERITEHYSEITEKVSDDGGLEDKLNDANFCKICKDSDELESAEDLSYHMINDHDPQEVLALYRNNWI